MSEDEDRAYEKRGTRIMWISSGAILLLILGAMGINMYLNPDGGKLPTNISSQSRQ